MTHSHALTKYPTGSLRELLFIIASLILVQISTSLMGFFDRLILANYSLESLEAYVSATNLGSLFQIPCVRIAAITQVVIGQYRGSNQLELMGKSVWQMIWFAPLTMGLTLPLGLFIGPLFFASTSIAEEGTRCFQYLMAMNFLLPLGAALSSFYLGRGNTRIILISTVVSHVVNILLDFPLIFGIEGILPPLGIRGAVLATALAQGVFCTLLFLDFFKSTHQQLYGTNKWKLEWTALKKSLKMGTPWAFSAALNLSGWALVTHIMLRQGENHLAVLTLGGSLFVLFTCVFNSLQQGIITVGAYIIGTKNWGLMKKLYKSAFLFLAGCSLFVAIPCLFYPEVLISLFFRHTPSPYLMSLLTASCLWMWLYFIAQGMHTISSSLLSAYGDMNFQMISTFINVWVFGCPAVFCGIELWGLTPDKFWLFMTNACVVSTLVCSWRFRQEKWKTVPPTS